MRTREQTFHLSDSAASSPVDNSRTTPSERRLGTSTPLSLSPQPPQGKHMSDAPALSGRTLALTSAVATAALAAAGLTAMACSPALASHRSQRAIVDEVRGLACRKGGLGAARGRARTACRGQGRQLSWRATSPLSRLRQDLTISFLSPSPPPTHSGPRSCRSPKTAWPPSRPIS